MILDIPSGLIREVASVESGTKRGTTVYPIPSIDILNGPLLPDKYNYRYYKDTV